MCKRMFALLALAISLFGTQCWAQSCNVEESNCHTFTPNSTTFTYTFVDGSRLVVHFVTVLTTFDLRVSVSHPQNPLPLDPEVFPKDTLCVQYPTNPFNSCDQYDFTGNAGGPHGVPVKNTDYKNLITLTLSYFTSQTVHNPAFGHAPGDITTFTEDILTGYSSFPPCPPTLCEDPTMDGETPGLSSVVALDKPLEETDTFCFVSPQENQTFSVGQEIEVAFRLVALGAGCATGTPIRDKTARLSLSRLDPNGNVVFPRVRKKGNRFHFDTKDGVNELDLSTHRLAPGRYTITIFGSKFSPQSVDINLVPGIDPDDPD
jgi:hypothetical protein